MDFRAFFAVRHMELFSSAGAGRETNDANNKRREDILLGLYSTSDPSLQDIRRKWIAFLPTLCSHPYDDVVVRKRAGRSANYDFDISFLSKGRCVKSVKVEFKHNASTIDSLPQYFSPAADKPYFPRLYADFFYDSLDQICEVYPGLSDHKPDRATYVRLVHNNDYTRHPFFETLYMQEESGTPEQKKQKRGIVCDTIRRYLAEYANNLDLSALSADIRDRQSGKVFVLWDLDGFRMDVLHDDELDIVDVEGVKNGNTIVAVSKRGTKHNMLLRWKNHLGILYPAWQISLSR